MLVARSSNHLVLWTYEKTQSSVYHIEAVVNHLAQRLFEAFRYCKRSILEFSHQAIHVFKSDVQVGIYFLFNLHVLQFSKGVPKIKLNNFDVFNREKREQLILELPQTEEYERLFNSLLHKEVQYQENISETFILGILRRFENEYPLEKNTETLNLALKKIKSKQSVKQLLFSSYDILENKGFIQNTEIFSKLFHGISKCRDQKRYLKELLKNTQFKKELENSNEQSFKQHIEALLLSGSFLKGYKSVPWEYKQKFLDALFENNFHNCCDIKLLGTKAHQYFFRNSFERLFNSETENVDEYLKNLEKRFIGAESTYHTLSPRWYLEQILTRHEALFSTEIDKLSLLERLLGFDEAFKNKELYLKTLKIFSKEIPDLLLSTSLENLKIAGRSYSGNILTPLVSEDISKVSTVVKELGDVNIMLASNLLDLSREKVLRLSDRPKDLSREKTWIQTFTKAFPLTAVTQWVVQIYDKQGLEESRDTEEFVFEEDEDTVFSFNEVFSSRFNENFSLVEAKYYIDKLCKELKSNLEVSYDSLQSSATQDSECFEEYFEVDSLDRKLAKFKMIFPQDCFESVLNFNEFSIQKELLLAHVFSDIALLKELDFTKKSCNLKALDLGVFVKYLLKTKPRQAGIILQILIDKEVITEKLICSRTKKSLRQIFHDTSPFIDLDLKNFIINSLESFQFANFLDMPDVEKDISTTLPSVPKASKLTMEDLTTLYFRACEDVGAKKDDLIISRLSKYIEKIKEKKVSGLPEKRTEAYQRLENNLYSFLYAFEKFLNDKSVDSEIKRKKCDSIFFVIKEIAIKCVAPFQKDFVEMAIRELRDYLPLDEDFEQLVACLEDPKKILVREVKKAIGEFSLNKAKFFFLMYNSNTSSPIELDDQFINHFETAFLDWFREKIFKIPFSPTIKNEDIYAKRYTIPDDLKPIYLKRFKKDFHPLAILEMLQNHFESLGIFHNKDEADLVDWKDYLENYIKNHWSGIPGKDYQKCADTELFEELVITEGNCRKNKLIEREKKKNPLSPTANRCERVNYEQSIIKLVSKKLEKHKEKFEVSCRKKAFEALKNKPFSSFETNEKIKSLKFSDGIATIYGEESSSIPEKVGISRFVIHSLLLDSGIAVT